MSKKSKRQECDQGDFNLIAEENSPENKVFEIPHFVQDYSSITIEQ